MVLSLGFLFLLLAHPVWKFWWIEKSRIRRLAGLAVLGLGVFLFGKQTWPSGTTSDHSFPKLEGRVDEVSVGASPWDANSSSVTIVASVRNMGAPSIASDFRLFVNVPGLPRKEAIPYYVPKDLVLKVKPTDPESSRYLVSSDLLYEKALRNPIQTGALIRGFLVLVEAFLGYRDIKPPTCKELADSVKEVDPTLKWLTPRKASSILQTMGFKTRHTNRGAVVEIEPDQLNALLKRFGIDRKP